MAHQGFGKSSKRDPLGIAAEAMFAIAQKYGKPLLVPMFPPGNHRGLAPGETALGQSEIPPDCDGIVAAIACSADEAQELIDLLMVWQKKRLAKQQGGDRTS